MPEYRTKDHPEANGRKAVRGDQQRVIAFIFSCKQKEIVRETEGFVVFTSPGLEFEIEQVGRHIDDFLDLAQYVEANQSFPKFMTWEGSVRYTDDDYFTAGSWRRSTGAEIIACSQGRNPFTGTPEENRGAA